MTGGLVTASLADDGILAGLLFGLSFKRRSGSVEPGQPGTDADALEDPDVVDFESDRMTAVIHLSQFHVGDVSASLSVALVELFDGRCIGRALPTTASVQLGAHQRQTNIAHFVQRQARIDEDGAGHRFENVAQDFRRRCAAVDVGVDGFLQ